MGHVATSHHQGHHTTPLSLSPRSPTDHRAPAGRINGYPTINQAAKTGPSDGHQEIDKTHDESSLDRSW